MKLLYITSLSGKRINGFMLSAILAARELGIDFTMACNMNDADKELYSEDCKKYGIKVVHISFERDPLNYRNLQAKKQLLKLMQNEKYDVVHCNTPIGGLLGRICAFKVKTPFIIYQAHGFHFWRGAPIRNWLLYYPVERFMAQYTNMLVTINKEDFHVAQSFQSKRCSNIRLVHGVGVQQIKSKLTTEQVELRRNNLHISKGQIVFISVGELNDNKNHKVVIEALAKMNEKRACYIICGEGERKNYLLQLISKNNLNNQVKLLGYRSDVIDMLQIADIFVFPSKREGLSVALMEAMEAGLPCVAGRIRGNIDLLPESELLFDTNNYKELIDSMKKAMSPIIASREKEKNLQHIKEFEFNKVVCEYKSIYKDAMINARNNYADNNNK